MDLMTAFIFLGSFSLAAGLAFLVSVFGAKEKTFEEALEEQKKQLELEKKQKVKEIKKDKDKKKTKWSKKKVEKDDKVPALLRQPVVPETVLPSSESPVNIANTLKKKRKKQRKHEDYGGNAQVEHNVLEVHRQYLQDDVTEEDVRETESTPEPPAQEPIVEQVEEPVEALPVEAQPVKKHKKKKMVIDEVDEVAEPEQPVVVNQHVEEVKEEIIVQTSAASQEVKPSPVPAKKSKGKKTHHHVEADVQIAPSGQPSANRDFIATVRRTPMDDTEVQQLIDILLDKQSGSVSNGAGEWMESGGKKDESGNIKKQLQDKETELREEQEKSKSLMDRLTQLRKELQQSKIAQSGAQRVLDEMQTRHQHETATLQSRLQSEIERQQLAVEQLQTQLQYQMTHCQQLETNMANMQMNEQRLMASQQVIDPQVMAELETLRLEKEQYEANFNHLQGQLNMKCEEGNQYQTQIVALQQQVTDFESQKQALEAELSSVKKECKGLSEKAHSLENQAMSNSGHLQGKVDELTRAKSELESRLSDMSESLVKTKSQLKTKESELARLAEENDRISDQLASTVERPVAEGQEAGGKQNGEMNGSLEKNVEEDGWQKKLQTLQLEKEKIVKENSVMINDLQSELHSFQSQIGELKADVSKYQAQIGQLEGELKQQKSKNDELRSKNWKVMEALNNSEQSYQKLLKKQTPSTSSTQINVATAEASQKEFLLRLFPDVEPKAKDDHQAWLNEFEIEAKKHLGGGDEALEKQVAHYQSVLAQTETMLNELQSSVEQEEGKWRAKLADKESELAEVRQERDALFQKTLQETEGDVKRAEEMQVKLHELQERLNSEEAQKKELETKMVEKERLQKELEEVRATLDSERSSRDELSAKVAKMNQLLSSGQEALQHEQRAVEMLKEQIANAKGCSEGSTSENGPAGTNEELPTPDSSQLGSVASLDLSSETNSPKKKSKKKKLLRLFK